MSVRFPWLIAGLFSALAATAADDPQRRGALDPQEIEAALGAYTPDFFFAYLHPKRWAPVGADGVLVWAAPNRAYLLGLTPCPTLLTARFIRLEQRNWRVAAGRDHVVADGRRCPIQTIRHVDEPSLPTAPLASDP